MIAEYRLVSLVFTYEGQSFMMVRDIAGDRAAAMTGITKNGQGIVELEGKDAVRPGFDDLLAHREGVFRICLGFTRDRAEAEDLAQDVYLRAYRNLGRMREPFASKEWLYRIAKNACLDRNKKARLRAQLLRRWASDGTPAGDRKPSDAADERLARLKAEVQRLPKKLSAVLVLRFYGGLSYQEIARTLGLAKGTVMSRLSRARARIAESLMETRP